MSARTHDIHLKWETEGTFCKAAFQLSSEGVTALIGPSGAGKTSLARLLAGLDTASAGYIKQGVLTIFDSNTGTNIPAHKRGIALVSQENALIPTLSVTENIELTCCLGKQPLSELIATAEISTLLDRRVGTLSGGEARRVAIVRALASSPRLLILDEPMTGLDPKRRQSMLAHIKKLATQTKTPVLLITHYLEDMLLAADHALLMANGHVLQSGRMEDVLTHPLTAENLGIDDAGSLLTATVTDRKDGLVVADLGGETLLVPDDGEETGSKLHLRVLARDVGLSVSAHKDMSILNQLKGIVTSFTKRESDVVVSVKLEKSGQILASRISQLSATRLNMAEGKELYALVKAVAVKTTP